MVAPVIPPVTRIITPDRETNRAQDEARNVINRTAAVVNAIKPPAYIEILENNETGSAITVTTGGTFYQWVTGAAGESSSRDFAYPGTMSSVIVGPSGPGVYIVTASFAVTLSGLGAEIQMAVFQNGAQTHLRMDTDSTVAAPYQNLVITGTLALAAQDTLTVRFSSSANGRTITVKHANFNLHRVA